MWFVNSDKFRLPRAAAFSVKVEHLKCSYIDLFKSGRLVCFIFFFSGLDVCMAYVQCDAQV